MNKLTSLAYISIIASIFTFCAQASVIVGNATDYGSTSKVGITSYLSPNVASNPGLNDEYIKYYIPLNSYNDPNAPYTYGVDNFKYSRYDYKDHDAGLKQDKGNVYYNSPDQNAKALLNMFIHFTIPEGEVGESIKLTFKDLDLIPTNDPNYFNERLFLGGYGQDDIREAHYNSWTDLDQADEGNVTYDVSYIDGSPVQNDINEFNQPNDYMTLTIAGLNVTSGDYWFRLGFQAYSDYNGKLYNTAEYLKAEMHTAMVSVEVNETAPVALSLAFSFFFMRIRSKRAK